MTQITAEAPNVPVFSPEDETSVQPPEIILNHALLYHGSARAGIANLEIRDELADVHNTLGTGLYFTHEPNAAAGYAKVRSKSLGDDKTSTVYTVETADDVRIANLDNADMLKTVTKGFAEVMREQRERAGTWFAHMALDKSLATVPDIRPGFIKPMTFSQGDLFANYMQQSGFDGIKSTEGGESNQLGNHTSYVIFDPTKVNVIGSESV